MSDVVLRNVTAAPRFILWASLAALVAASWLFLAAAPADWLAALCGPSARPPGFAPMLLMWSAMTLAMMLPVAVPMLSAYLDIAEAARAKAIAVVPPWVLASGYLAVWFAFSFAIALSQLAFGGFAPTRQISGLVLIGAGLYQFAPLKHACLRKCRSPMPLFLSRWSERPVDIFKLGVEQGVACLGCCWTVMLLGFATGAMNAAWMASIGILMILERTLPEPRPVIYGAGIGLIVAGGLLMMGGGA
jgi:predicted metal-binding membrane protein